MEEPFSFEVELTEEEQKSPLPENKAEISDEVPLPPRYWPDSLFANGQQLSEDGKVTEGKKMLPKAPEPRQDKEITSAMPGSPVAPRPENQKLREDIIEDVITPQEPVSDKEIVASKPEQSSQAKVTSEPITPIPPSKKNLKISPTEPQVGKKKTSLLDKLKSLFKKKSQAKKPVKKNKRQEKKPAKASPKPEVKTKPRKQEQVMSSESRPTEKAVAVNVVETKANVDEDSFEKQRLKRAERRNKRLLKEQKKKERQRKKEKQDVGVIVRNFREKRKAKKQEKEKQQALEAQQLVRAPKKEKKEKQKKEKKDVFAGIKEYFRHRKDARSRKIQKDIVGLHIGASAIKAVLLSGDNPVIYHADLPEGIIVNGKLEEPEELTRYLRTLWQESGLSSKKVNFSIDNNQIIFRLKKIAAKKEKDIRQALSMNADIMFEPLEPKDLQIDYSELSRSGQAIDLQVVAANEKMVEEFTDAIEKAGLLAVNCEAGAIVTNRAFRIPWSASQAHMIVDVGAETTTVTAASGKDTLFMRVLPIGGNDFTEAIQKSLQTSWLQAEDYKQRSGLTEFAVDPTLDDQIFSQCKRAMQPVVDRLAQEILLTKNFYQSDERGRVISGWSLIGGGGRLVGLDQQIGIFTQLNQPVKLEPYPGFEDIPDLDINATALGLARGYEMSLIPEVSKNSNIQSLFNRQKSKLSLNKSKKKAKDMLANEQNEKKIPFKPLGFLIALLIIGAGFMYDSDKHTQTKELQTQITSLETDLETRFGPRPAPQYYNSQPATDLAEKMFATPVTQNLEQINSILEGAGIDNLKYQIKGVHLTITGRGNRKTMNNLLETIKATEGLSSAQLNQKGAAFELVIILQPFIELGGES